LKRSPMPPRKTPMQGAKLRSKKCPPKRGGCGQTFTPSRPMQVACGPLCAVKVGQHLRLQAEKVNDRQKRERLMTLSDWRKRAQAAINQWVKLRDAGLPCISCGAPPRHDDQCGHFLTRGARRELALNPLNMARQCVRCNLHLHGNQAAYRVGLIQRIGLSEVERLEGPHPPRHDTADGLKALAAEYRAKARALKARA
jgi:hypothetical protein